MPVENTMANKMTSQVGAVPNPDPTVRTVEQLQRDIGASREIVESKLTGRFQIIETRLSGMDKAIELLQRATDRIPQHVQGEVAQLKDLHQEKFNSIQAQVAIQFAGIAIQFLERDKRTEQLSLADKTAIAAALQAQKEAAGAQNETAATANTKMENNFAKLIEQGQGLLMEVRRNTEAQINDLKSRLDKGEGRTSVSDPATVEALRQMGAAVGGLAQSRDQATGGHKASGDQTSFIFGIVGMAMAVISVLLVAFKVMT